jgi:hypothetical protein
MGAEKSMGMREVGVVNYATQIIIHDDLSQKYLLFLFTVFFGFYILFSRVLSYKHMEAMTISYDLTAPIALAFISFHGVSLWFGLNGYPPLENNGWDMDNADIRNFVIIPMMCYQFWNIFATILVDEYRTTWAIVHHITTVALAFGTLYPLFNYYTVYFYGFSEVSTLFLCLSILPKRFPKFHENFSFVATFFEGLFAISFFAFRIFYYFPIIFNYWIECWQEIMKFDHVTGLHAFVLLTTIILTYLQLFFAKEIFVKIKGFLQKEEDVRKDK